MSYHKAQQGLDKPGTSHPSSIPAWSPTSRARDPVGPLGTQPFLCLDVHMLQLPWPFPSPLAHPLIVVLWARWQG